MPRFSIEGPDIDPTEIESDNWMSALGEALELFGVRGDAAGGVECDVLGDGDIAVRTPAGSFTIHEVVETIARIRVGPGTRMAEAPTISPRFAGPELDTASPPSPLDAPDPTASTAWRAREESSEAILTEVHARTAAFRDAPTAEAACRAALDLLMEYVPAESGAVLLQDPDTHALRFVVARGPRSRGLTGQSVPAGKGIAGLSVRSGVALTVREAATDPRHYPEVDARTGYRSNAILCVPVRNQRATLGCVELLNPFAGTEFATWHQSATLLVAARLAQRLG